MKSPIVLDYNNQKQGIDLSGQLSTCYTCLRRSKKWYLEHTKSSGSDNLFLYTTL